jgi:hypothetical protein
MSEMVIETSGLRKVLGGHAAVDGLDLRVHGWKHIRVPRKEWRRQNHHHPVAARLLETGRRRGQGLRRDRRRSGCWRRDAPAHRIRLGK